MPSFLNYHSELLYDYRDNQDNQTASSDGLYVGGSGGSIMKSNRKMSQVFMWLISVGIGVPLGYYLIPDKMSVWQCLWYQCIIQWNRPVIPEHCGHLSERSDAVIWLFVRVFVLNQVWMSFPHRFSFQVDFMCIVNQAIEDGIGWLFHLELNILAKKKAAQN